MNTPSIKAGENPVADAAAAEHVKGLLSTGMAYEFQPETIATRAFLDGFALGAAELTRVTAERNSLRAEVADHLRPHLRAAYDERDALRARVAEQDAKLEYVHGMGLRFGMMKSSDKPEPYLAHTWDENSDHERMFREWSASIGWESRVAKAEQRVAELEDAAKLLLDELDEEARLQIGNPDADLVFDHVPALRDLLASAESATPPKNPDTLMQHFKKVLQDAAARDAARKQGGAK